MDEELENSIEELLFNKDDLFKIDVSNPNIDDELENQIWELFCNQEDLSKSYESNPALVNACYYFVVNHNFDLNQLPKNLSKAVENKIVEECDWRIDVEEMEYSKGMNDGM